MVGVLLRRSTLHLVFPYLTYSKLNLKLRSVERGWVRRTLVVAVDAYPFLALLDLPYRL